MVGAVAAHFGQADCLGRDCLQEVAEGAGGERTLLLASSLAEVIKPLGFSIAIVMLVDPFCQSRRGLMPAVRR